ncbi:MAG: hypothetical protein LBR94_06945 [Desulfovibrio sp.]|jgi:hypothetical protein|nr:hypothetical protein [Desulfovibrio sp.]
MAGGHTLPAGSYEFVQSDGVLTGNPVMRDGEAMQGVTGSFQVKLEF